MAMAGQMEPREQAGIAVQHREGEGMAQKVEEIQLLDGA